MLRSFLLLLTAFFLLPCTPAGSSSFKGYRSVASDATVSGRPGMSGDLPAGRVRIGIKADGLYRLTAADMHALGVDTSRVNPRALVMQSGGEEISIRVVGEEDGVFDPDDRIEFFAQQFRGSQMEEKYTDERVYWLDFDGQGGHRVPDLDASPRFELTPPADFATTLRAEQSLIWWTLYTLNLDTQDTWFWGRLAPVGAGQSVSRNFNGVVPDPAAAYTATIRFEQISRAGQESIRPDHRTTLNVNGTLLLDETWDGQNVRKLFTAEIPPGKLINGVNQIRVAATNQPGISADDIYFNYWEIDYRRLFRARDGRLDFRTEAAGPAEYRVTGWNDPAVAIWDVTDPHGPARLVGAASAVHGAEVDIAWRTEGPQGSRYWLQSEASVAVPASIGLRLPTDLRSPTQGAQSVIVAPSDLLPAAERLADWHRRQGRSAVAIDIQDIYDEFNFSILNPVAVPNMLAWARNHWPSPTPTYLTLLGDGHWNMKGFNPGVYPAQPNPIPPYLAWVDPWQGEVPADALYGDIDGDGLVDLAVGRIPVNTLAEAEVVVSKIENYGSSIRIADWQRNVLFVADNPDESGDFPAVSDEIIATKLAPDLHVERVYLLQTTPNAESARQAIVSAVNQGVFMIQYTGHGATGRWSNESMWRREDIALLTNLDRLPVVMTFNCLDGYFAHPDPDQFSIAEVMLRSTTGGSIAAISPSGLGKTVDQTRFRKILMDVIFRDGVLEIGTALTTAKRAYNAMYGADYVQYTTSLIGEPALRLPEASVQNRLPLMGMSR
jgi:hypothetical protein